MLACIRKFLKWLRGKWHRDITTLMNEQYALCQEKRREETGVMSRGLHEMYDLGQARMEEKINALGQKLTPAPAPRTERAAEGIEDLAHRLEIEKAFSLLQDRESQKLFWARLHFSEYGDVVPLFRLLMQMDRTGNPKDLISLLRDRIDRKNQERELILFGTTGNARELFLTAWRLGCKADYVCKEDTPDEFTYSTAPALRDFDWNGVPIITEDELFRHHRDAQVMIGDIRCGVCKWYLVQKGFPADQIFQRHTQWDVQYLDAELMRPGEHEVYVDGGVLDLTNTLEFIEWCGGRYDDVYAFEPDTQSYARCLDRIQTDSRLDEQKVHLLHAALWKRDENLVFRDGNGGSSTVDAEENSTIQGRSIDSVLQGKPVTFIKLDIEGAEMDALIGARMSIKKWKPRLAVCVYHRREDLVEIPLYIHGLVPEYKMYLRHYSTCRAETVLYCIYDPEQ